MSRVFTLSNRHQIAFQLGKKVKKTCVLPIAYFPKPTINIYTGAVPFSPDENTLYFQVCHFPGMPESHME